MSDTAKDATAFLRAGIVLIQAYLPTTAGVLIASGPVHSVRQGEIELQGDAVRKAISLPYAVLPHPAQRDWKAVSLPMLEAAGVKTWKALAKGSRVVGISVEETIIRLEPMAQYDRDGGRASPGLIAGLGLSNLALGTALAEAFDRCE
jgi:hypothetical protein